MDNLASSDLLFLLIELKRYLCHNMARNLAYCCTIMDKWDDLTNPAMATLTATDLSAGYGVGYVLHDIDCAFDAGVHILLGPNGAGKTTLFRVMSGILPPAAGTVLVAGQDPHAKATAKTLVGLATHRPALSARLTVADNLRFWARVLQIPPRLREQQVDAVIGLLDLADIITRRAGKLSRGQAQRAALAKAMLSDPPVLLLDEPTAGLDPESAAGVRRQMRSLADAGRTILQSTHDLAEASTLADDITVLRAGRIAARGSPEQLQRELLGNAVRLRIRGSDNLVSQLARLGYRADVGPEGAVHVDVDSEESTEELVRQLVGAGVGIREVSVEGTDLEDIYLRLQRVGGA